MIVYLISNYKGINTGRGGHYYSLLQMAEEISKNSKILIISIGDKQPAIFSNIEYAHHLKASLITMPFLVKKISKLIKDQENKEINVIHGYDEFTVYLLRKLSKLFSCEMVLTKCGGAIKKNLPCVPKLIVFHSKDYEFYKNNKAIGKVYKIPNRVKPTIYNSDRINQLNKIYEDGYFHIVKIGRIGKYYFNTLKQAINLAEIFCKNKKIKLILIGYLESPFFANQLKSYAKQKNVELEFFSDSKFTRNASELIWGAELVIGTGRGAMEALSAGKLLFFPVSGRDLPCLFDVNTAEYAMENNFSERTKIPENLNYYFSQSMILDLIKNEDVIKEKIEFGRKIFNEHFCVMSGAQYLYEVYNDKKNEYKEQLNPISNIKLFIRFSGISIKNTIKPWLIPFLDRMKK